MLTRQKPFDKDVVSKMDSLSFSRSLVLLLALILTYNEAQKDMTEVKLDPNDICDDGKSGIESDLGPESNWKCQSETSFKEVYLNPSPVPTCNRTHFTPTFVCMNDPLEYSDHPPLVGDYRPVAPQYGEYTYLPPQRWLHALRLGAVAFLYHPCTPQEQVNLLRDLAQTCLWKYVLTPYPHLTEDQPLALVSWGCIYRMEWVKPESVKMWLHQNALRTDESLATATGAYSEGLVLESDQNIPVNEICHEKATPPPEVPSPVENTPDNATTNQNSPCPHADTPSNDSDNTCSGPTTTLVLVDTSHHRLTILMSLAIIILLLAILLVLWRLMVSCRGRVRVKGKYKSVSKYFPVSAGRGDGMAIPEMGIPKDGLSEREKLLDESDEDEL